MSDSRKAPVSGGGASPARGFLDDDPGRDGPLWLRLALAAAAAASALGLAVLLLSLPARAPLLPVLVDEALGRSGVSNPVTAVLLSFRAYDTLLEVAVLLVAMVGAWSLDRGSRLMGREREERKEDPVLRSLARFVAPLAGIMAVYLTWAGSHRPGGAFQAGALLAGAGVMMVAAGFLRPFTAASPLVRGVMALGIFVFLVAGAVGIPWTGTFLGFPEGWAYSIIIAVEIVLTLAIAVVLVELFADIPAVPEPDPALERVDPSGDPLGRLLEPEVEDPES